MKKGLIHRFLVSKVIPFLSRHPALIIGVGLIYLIVPFDLFPEALTGILGYIDDIFALLLSYLVVQKVQSFQAQFQKQSRKSPIVESQDPYDILGVARGASKEEITKAYRKKIAEYHPDKVNHLGEDLKKTAHQKTLQIQKAYEALVKKA